MKPERRIPILLLAVSVALLLLVPTAPAKAQTVLSDVTVTSQPDALTVHVKTSREPKYRAELIDAPNRLVVDLEDAVYAWRKTPLSVGPDPLKQIRGSQYRKGVAPAPCPASSRSWRWPRRRGSRTGHPGPARSDSRPSGSARGRRGRSRASTGCRGSP
ncbi:MAG: AMIN domain-containing protein [Candidatus Rokubacteria bacterium]|nr:AMIN domain-containing protein [Candidatus Rokubacteria bacterium]